MTNEDRNKSPQTLEETFRLITKLHARVHNIENQLADLATLYAQIVEYSSICEEVAEQLEDTQTNHVEVGSNSWDVPEHQMITSSTSTSAPY